MDRERTVDLLNKIAIAQGEIQRVMIWLSRLHKDLDEFKKEVLKDINESS